MLRSFSLVESCGRMYREQISIVLCTVAFAAIANWLVFRLILLWGISRSKMNFKFKKGNHHHQPHVMPQARISLTLFRHFSLSFIASGRSSELHPGSSHSCWMNVRAGRPAFARPYVGIHRSTTLMSSSLLLQQCPACLARLTWIVFVMAV